ncbi:MAG: hypothetical protein VW620_11990 [Rhodospirillales bacterium]|jgi:phage shock protein PspC (stress-responsive transcriptional regulator)
MSKRRKIGRGWYGAAFAVAGVIAGAVHVLTVAPESFRLWREVLPLSGAVGFLLGALIRPSGMFAGAAAGVAALFIFALAYSLGETLIQVIQGELLGVRSWILSVLHWMNEVLTQIGVAAAAAVFLGGILGLLISRSLAR